MSQLKVDLDLVKKYNVPGPRYTSYPPATHFTNEIPAEAFVEQIRANNTSARDLSLYYHLPFCQTLCWFCGCTTVITTDQKKSGDYLKYIEREMDLMKPLMNPKRKVVQLHFGGGTPTFLLPDEIRRLGEMIHSRFTFAADVEAGVEVDPRRLTRDHLLALREIGFNRTSMGVQDNEAKVQEAVHRIQPFAMTKQTVEWMRELGFQSINIDLIYGLPYQTPESFDRTITETLSLKPDRFAVFNYAHVPWMKPAQKILQDRALPSPEAKVTCISAWTTSRERRMNWRSRSSERRCSETFRATARVAALTSMLSACLPFLRPKVSIGKISRSCPIIMRHWTRVNCRSIAAIS
jgi:oxygen-independent coproporphyrinogen-3 oxidase